MVSEALVLIVDDDSDSRRVLAQLLNRAGFETEEAESSDACFERIQHRVPAVILLDLMMPAPDGYEVLKRLRKHPQTASVPVLVLTGLDDDRDFTRAFELGADDFVRKPFRASELLARIRGQLRVHGYVEALARKERDVALVLELTQALSSTLDFRHILFTVVHRIAEFAGVERCSLVLVRDKGDVGYVVAASDDKELRDLPIDLSKYPEIQQVMSTGSVLVIPDASTHPLFDLVRSEMPQNPFRWFALMPILFEGKPMGVLFLRSRAPVHLDEHKLSLARTVVNATAIALRNARILQSLRDQTQQISVARFEAERRLKALQRYADFFYSTADGIVVIDPDTQILFSNPQAQYILRRSKEELTHLYMNDLFAPESRPPFADLRAGFSKSVFPHMVDLVIERAGDGPEEQTEKRTLNVSFSSVLREDSGAIVVSFRDVTTDRAIAAELTKTKEFLERVIESSADAIISVDMKGLVLLFNRAAERMYGYDAREVVGIIRNDVLFAEGQAEAVANLIRSKDYGGPGRLQGYRTEIISKDGVRIPVSLSAALIMDGSKPVGSVDILTDLRERIQMETLLNEAQEELRTREKQAWIAELAGAAAHELNQPLTTIVGYCEMLRRRPDQPELASKVANIISGEAERMAEVVRKIGHITRYETKNYVGSSKIIDLDRSSVGDHPEKLR